MRSSTLVLLLVLFTGVNITAQQVPRAMGSTKMSSSSGGGDAGDVAGGVTAVLVIICGLTLATVLCYLCIRRTKGFKEKCCTNHMIATVCPCFALTSKRSDDAYEPVTMNQVEHTEPQVDITASMTIHAYEPMEMNMHSVTTSLQTHTYEPTDMNTSSIAIPSTQNHPYEPTDMNTSSIFTTSLFNPYEPVNVNASIVSASLNPYEPVEVGKISDKDTRTTNTAPEPRYSKAPDVSGDKANVGFTNKLALVTPESKGSIDVTRPDEDQATRAALYGSYDVPRPMDPYDIPRGSSVSHPPPPGELYDTPRTSQYDTPRTSVSVHPPKGVDPSDAKDDVSHTYDIPV